MKLGSRSDAACRCVFVVEIFNIVIIMQKCIRPSHIQSIRPNSDAHNEGPHRSDLGVMYEGLCLYTATEWQFRCEK